MLAYVVDVLPSPLTSPGNSCTPREGLTIRGGTLSNFLVYHASGKATSRTR